jgi:hypothetical protein
MSTREEFLENEIRTLNHHIQSLIDTMKVMSMNKQDMSDEIERLKLEVETAVKDEREACAVIAFSAKTYLEAAAAIRARGQS